MSDIVIYQEPPKLDIKARGAGYVGEVNGNQITLQRDVDFGLVPKAKTPSLFKPGAEKVIWAYGLLERYTLESKHEDHETGYFFYCFRCDLIKLTPEWGEIVVKSGWGSANTKEYRNGANTGHNAANSNIKMAKKRAMIDAAISVGRLSGMFTQDIEAEETEKQAKAMVASDSPEDFISPKQAQRIFAVAAVNGITNERAKEILKAAGHESTRKIKQKDFDTVLALMEGKHG